MEQVMILNASPRAARSNSKEYAAIFLPAAPFPASILPSKASRLPGSFRRWNTSPICFWFFPCMWTACR